MNLSDSWPRRASPPRARDDRHAELLRLARNRLGAAISASAEIPAAPSLRAAAEHHHERLRPVAARSPASLGIGLVGHGTAVISTFTISMSALWPTVVTKAGFVAMALEAQV